MSVCVCTNTTILSLSDFFYFFLTFIIFPKLRKIVNCADSEGGHVASQLVPVSEATRKLQKLMHEAGSLPSMNHAAAHELTFVADLPALGYATFFVGHTSDKVGMRSPFS
jgi:hypothetical protein